MGVFGRIFNRFHIKSFWNFLFLCCCSFIISLCLVLVAAGSELYDVESTTEVSSTEFTSGDIENDLISQPTQNSSSELILIDFSTSIQTISANDTTGFKSVILGLIGPYEMLTKEYTYTNPSSSYQSKQVTTEPDYSWMISAAIFIIVLYCLLRILGGVICGRG